MAEDFPFDVQALLKVFDYLNAGVYLTDLDRRILLWNRKAEEITGWKAADVVGKRCRDNVLNHIDKEGNLLCVTHLCPLYRSVSTGNASKAPVIVYGLKPTGGRVALSTSVAPLRDSDGRIVGGIEVFTDVTEALNDLEFAQKVQRHIMPKKLPVAQGLRFEAHYHPHDMVGGDFYDVSDMGGGKYSMLAADVRGHGVSASLYTMVLKSLSQPARARAKDPGEFLSLLNSEITALVVEESFATAACAVIDSNSWQVVYSSAGQPPAIHYSAAARRTETVESFGLPLGLDPSEGYESVALNLMPGDALLFYSDGMTDVRLENGKMLGTEGLAGLLADEMAKGGERLPERIHAAVVELNSEVALADDALLLSAVRLP